MHREETVVTYTINKIFGISHYTDNIYGGCITELTLTLPDTIVERLRDEASEHNLTIEIVIHTAIVRYFMDEEILT